MDAWRGRMGKGDDAIGVGNYPHRIDEGCGEPVDGGRLKFHFGRLSQKAIA